MTPERIEEIKKVAELYPRTPSSYVNELLTALEESQKETNKQTVEAERLKDICNQLAGEEMLFQDGKYETEMQSFETKLAEAQQTIARQRENERAIIYEISEIHKEAAAGNSGSLDRADIALNRIMLLSSNLLVLGNKEGSDKA